MKRIIETWLGIILYMGSLYSQNSSTVLTSSLSGKYPYTVGDIFVTSTSGSLATKTIISRRLVSVEDILSDDDFMIYPNPTNAYFTIVSKSNASLDEISCINSNGTKFKIQDNDVSHLPAGVYFVLVNEKTIGKIVKN
jgi:hypothetical protein